MTFVMMAALLLIAAFWLTRPLWQRQGAVAVERRTANVVAYQTRLAELKADVEAGVIPVNELQALEQEMNSRLMADAGTGVAARVAGTPRQMKLATVLSLLLLIFAGGWYVLAGSWRVADQIAQVQAGGEAPMDPEVAAMVNQLVQRLAEQPGDAEGWAMLGRSYFAVGHRVEAAKAYAKANALTQNRNAEWLVAQGESLALSRDRDLSGEPAQLFDAALAVEPDYAKALWYGALADAQDGNLPRSTERFQLLLRQDLPDDLKAMVLGRLDELAELAGLPADSVAPAASEPATDDSPGKSAAGVTLAVQVSVSPELADRLAAAGTLFVFAKAADGPPVPLAVQKLPAAQLPLTVNLDDSMAMTPAMTLSKFSRYVVTARWSASGNALAASGDLEGSVEMEQGSDQPAVVVINRVVP